MPQFLVAPSDLDLRQATAVLRGDEARHLLRVLRARADDPVAVFDGQGHRWRGRFAGGNEREARVQGLTELPSNEPRLQVELIQAIPKRDCWERIVEKGTELGVTRFRPVYTERSVPRIPGSRVEERLRRWTQRALAAAKQCERARVPLVAAPENLDAVLARFGPAQENETRLILTERWSRRPPDHPASLPGSVLVAAGPEGGWSRAERQTFTQTGFQPVSLGPRILRTDTAAIAGLTVIQTLWGDLEGPATARQLQPTPQCGSGAKETSHEVP